MSLSKTTGVRPGQYLVKLRPGFKPASSEVKLDRLSDSTFLVEERDVALLSQSAEIETIVPNHLYRREMAESSDQIPSSQWGLHNFGQDGGKVDADIDAPEAWEVSKGDGVLVAVLDTGIDTRHPDLVDNLYRNPGEVPNDGIDNDGNGVIDDVVGYDAAERRGSPWSDDPHGSHCAGTIAASGRVLGVAGQAKILPIKIYDEDEWTDAATIIRALDYAKKAGAKVASHSYGGLHFNPLVEEAFRDAGMLHVVAAGNYSSNNDENKNYPSSYELDNLISVAASDRQDKIADFSNYGAESVHLAAPGVDILSTTSYGNLGSWSGTSMACPHVAGVGALVAAQHPEESPQEWRQRILDSVDVQEGWESKVKTGGRLNAKAALSGPSDR